MQTQEKSGTGQIKKIISTLDNNRKNVDSGNNVHTSIASAKQSFGQFEGVIRGQTGTIQNLKTFQKTMNSENTRLLQTKKFFNSFLEWMKEEMNNLFKIVEEQFRWGSLKVSKEAQISKTKSELLKLITQVREQSDTPEKIFNGLMKMLAIRDNIQIQIMRNMIYTKNILWRDLNMKYDDYIHGEIKAALTKIKESEDKFGYIPGKTQFKLPKLDQQFEGSKVSDLLTIILQDHSQLIQSMKNFSKLSEQPQLLEDISQNQHVVKSLRDKIEVLNKNYNTLLQKYRSLQISKGKVQLGASEQKSLSERIEDLEALVMKKEQDIIQLKQTSMKAESSMQSLKDKNRELEEEISKWQNFQLPKIKQLQNNQRAILDEFNKTKKDFETYSNLYQAEREDKIKAYGELKDERQRLTDMAGILGREKRKIKELKQELVRKEQIIMELVEKAPDP